MVINMECRAFMSSLPANTFDSIVTDPPYGLSKQPNMREVLKHWLNGDDYTATGGGFMGKSWDSFVPGPKTWEQAFRVLKPGGYAVVFAGSRTVDLMATSLRMAGFEVVDMLHWMYGSGFPKSQDIGKALDKTAGATREVIGRADGGIAGGSGEFTAGNAGTLGFKAEYDLTAPATDEAKQWDGWGTALKPCHEPIILCRKPLEGTYANNIMTHGCGALNIDGCRVGDEEMQRTKSNGIKISENGSMAGGNYGRVAAEPSQGRWPGNVLHDGCLPEPMDRYFYHAKASKADRDEGMDGFAHKSAGECTGGRGEDRDGLNSPRAGAGRTSGARNTHPTVKPTAVMQ